MASIRSIQRRRPLLRVRTGCLTCRARKKKCDEGKPICKGCTRNGLHCQWPNDTPIETRNVRLPRKSPPIGLPLQSDFLSRSDSCPSDVQATTALNSERNSSPESAPQQPIADKDLFLLDPDEYMDDGSDRYLDAAPESFDLLSGEFDFEEAATAESPSWLVQTSLTKLNEMIPAHPQFMPQLDHDRFDLFGHYIQTTANSMANGSTPRNPFLVQLLPLTISSTLVLESILVQSCAHRAVRTPVTTGPQVLTLYNKSLRSLRSAIDNIATHENEDLLALIVSMLILCFTETARGDVTGSIFFHLQATSSILPNALVKLGIALPSELRNFLVEYYIYTATLSMISMGVECSPQVLLSPQLLQAGQQLVHSGYVGNLCGCWLEILLFIPRIYDLGCQWSSNDMQSDETRVDLITMFAILQSEISQWVPSPDVPSDVGYVAYIFKDAMLLYLLTILRTPRQDNHSVHSAKITEVVDDAMLYLEKLSPAQQINTSLCWPIAVVGSCVMDSQQQTYIRERLKIMADSIGLGNITKTGDILEHMWSHDKRGPWEISKAMKNAEIWISFA